jgi:hypothetical protein
MNTEIFELTEERIKKLKRVGELLAEIHTIWSTEYFDGIGEGHIPVFSDLAATVPPDDGGYTYLKKWYGQAPFVVAFWKEGERLLLQAYVTEALKKKAG